MMNEFQAALNSSRVEFDQMYDDMRDRQAIGDRVFESYRTNDMTRMLIERALDLEIGQHVTVEPRPDWRALGVKKQEADAWAEKLKCRFEAYAHCPENWISANRQHSLTGFIRAAGRQRKIFGESFTTREWRGSGLGIKTCFQLINPNRVKTPSGSLKKPVFHGIEFDQWGAANAYHIQQARADQRRSFGQKSINRVTRYNRFGWLQVFHQFDALLAEYPRGVSPYCALLPKIEQREQAARAILDKEILAATIALIITSDDDPHKVAEMMAEVAGAVAQDDIEPSDAAFEAKKRECLKELMEARQNRMPGSVWMQFFSGENAHTLQSTQQTGSTSELLKGYAKIIANGANLSYEIATGDFSGVNYSGGQLSAGLTEFSVGIERKQYSHRLVELIWRSFLDEQILVRDPEMLLGGIPYRGMAREYYARCEIPGVRRFSADPLKDKKTAALAVATGIDSRSNIVAANGGNFNDLVEARTQDALTMLQGIEDAAKAKGLPLNDKDKMLILLKLITAERIKIDVLKDEPEQSEANASTA